ncbi:MAG TPA: enoyl-CoA hydratase [Rhodospirillaceae bacterium]|nr:enoyl-CoA hydratase [Rhodospirillaceae bacterium]
MTANILITRRDGLVELRFDRPEKKNALTTAMYAALADAMTAAAADPTVRVILFSGSGGSFCAGNDLNDFLANPPNSEDAPVFRFLRALAQAEAILVAAVSGPAVGVGTTMLLHCDMVIAGESAKFALPFVNLGLVPEAASSLLLPRLVGQQRAAKLLLLGEAFDARAAKDLGLVGEVVADADLTKTAEALVGKLLAKAPQALRLTKQLMKGTTATVGERMAEECRVFAPRLDSAEFKEAVSAFFDKRPPDFSPKPTK